MHPSVPFKLATPSAMILMSPGPNCPLLPAANKYWSLDKDGLVMASEDHPSNFSLQFVSSSCLVLKAPNKKYLVVEAGGRLWAGASDAASATPFRY